MNFLLEHPGIMSLLCGLAMLVFALMGIILNRRLAPDDGGRDYRGIFVSSSLGLLSLVIGFTLSMAVGRYDLRKSYEAHEANTISTERSEERRVGKECSFEGLTYRLIYI